MAPRTRSFTIKQASPIVPHPVSASNESESPFSGSEPNNSDYEFVEDSEVDLDNGEPLEDVKSPPNDKIDTRDIHKNSSGLMESSSDDTEDDSTTEPVLYDGNAYPAEHYRAAIDSMDVNRYTRKEYSKGTVRLMDHIEDHWRWFCTQVIGDSDWQSCLRNITFQVAYQFMMSYINQKGGKRGHKRPITKRSTLVTTWCTFRLVFERATTMKIDERINRGQMSNALVELGNKFDLTHKKRINRAMTLEDLKRQIDTTLRTTEKAFKLGELRVLAVLFLLLLAPQGSRPTSILELRFGDIEVLLVNDPTDAHVNYPPKLLIRLTLEYTKRYLGPKAANTFLIPEIIYDPSLLLSPHVFLLAVLFRHRAFKAEALNDSPDILHTLRVPQDCFELPLSFKDNIKDKFVFRQATKTSGGYRMSDAAITYSTMKEWIKRIGMLCGFETNTICYVLRYWAGNNLDQSVNVSSYLLNLVMEHAPNPSTFQRNYLCREVCADLWAIHRNTAPQQALIQQAASHGHSTDPRRPVTLSKDELADLKLDPAYTKLTRKMFEAPRRSAQGQSLSKQRHNLLSQLRNARLKQIRQQYTDKQAVEDIEQQIQGNRSSGTYRRPSRPMNDAHQRICNALNQPVATDIKTYLSRRAEAIAALVAYCQVEDPIVTIIQGRSHHTAAVSATMSRANQIRDLKCSVFVGIMGKELRRCFLCVAKAMDRAPSGDVLIPDRDTVLKELVRQFSSRASLTRHFESVHLGHQYDIYECPICCITLQDEKHLKAHAEGTHGIYTGKL